MPSQKTRHKKLNSLKFHENTGIRLMTYSNRLTLGLNYGEILTKQGMVLFNVWCCLRVFHASQFVINPCRQSQAFSL